MPADLLSRVRTALAVLHPDEKRMFGGTAFMIDGKMVASVSKRGLLLRVGKEGLAAALKNPQARPATMGQRTMSGYVRVNEAGLSDRDLQRWLDAALAHLRSLDAGVPPTKKRRAGSA
jgi:TfoX/Sxy family transcriptional regulator of competence genes